MPDCPCAGLVQALVQVSEYQAEEIRQLKAAVKNLSAAVRRAAK